jgi:hypothetical protein
VVALPAGKQGLSARWDKPRSILRVDRLLLTALAEKVIQGLPTRHGGAGPLVPPLAILQYMDMCVRSAILALVIGPLLGPGAAAQSPPPALVVVPLSLMASGPLGGPFSPPSFQYRVSATTGTVNYSISTPTWVTADPSTGTIDTGGVTVTLTINPSAQDLQPGAYAPAVRFANVTNGRGSTSRTVRLVVLAPKFATTGAGLGRIPGGYLLDDRGEPLLDGRSHQLLAR